MHIAECDSIKTLRVVRNLPKRPPAFQRCVGIPEGHSPSPERERQKLSYSSTTSSRAAGGLPSSLTGLDRFLLITNGALKRWVWPAELWHGLCPAGRHVPRASKLPRKQFPLYEIAWLLFRAVPATIPGAQGH